MMRCLLWWWWCRRLGVQVCTGGVLCACVLTMFKYTAAAIRVTDTAAAERVGELARR